MKRIAILLLSSLGALPPAMSQVAFQGASKDVITITPETSTGLNVIYVIYSLDGVSATYTPASASSGRDVKWLAFDNRGGGFAEAVTDVDYRPDGTSVLRSLDASGYIIEDGARRTYFWVVDYTQSPFSISALNADIQQSDCSQTALSAVGNAAPIHYYTINGRQMELSRELKLSYRTLVYDETSQAYIQQDVTKTLPHMAATSWVDAPLCDTDFSICGDRFLERWGMPREVLSPSIQATAVEAHTDAVQTERDADNEQKSETAGALGGSAPAEITFTAQATDAVVFKEWQIAQDADFYFIDFRDNNLEFTYTFRDEGTRYVRFSAANAEGTCEYFSPTYEVQIGESDIKCPNAFSPGSSEGVNDIWKVSYKSIISFSCVIFNRWGVKIASFSDPSQGWDGRYKGKIVPSGVYYYVIKARGADGRKYDLSGDINIIRAKERNRTSSGSGQ